MQKITFAVLGIIFSGLCSAEISAVPEQVPEGWFVHRDPASTRYTAFTDRSSRVEGEASGVLDSLGAPEFQFGTLMQAVNAFPYRGKRVRLSAQVQSQDSHKGWLWLRADRSDGTVVAFDNMSDRPIEGTTAWEVHEVVLDIPRDAVALAYGVGLRGGGKIWIDDVVLEEVGLEVSVTRASEIGTKKPPLPQDAISPVSVNLGFES